ncbi:hypothetical protein Tco_0659886 [Tanacetum coccineum]
MANIRTCNKHNMIACVEKTAQNADFYQIIDFLTGCSIKYSLLVDPDLIGPWLQQFWATASLKVINDVPHIRAKSKSTSWNNWDKHASALVGCQIVFEQAVRGVDRLRTAIQYVSLPSKSSTSPHSRGCKFLQGLLKALQLKDADPFSNVLLQYKVLLPLWTATPHDYDAVQILIPVQEAKGEGKKVSIRRKCFSQIGRNKDEVNFIEEQQVQREDKAHPFFDVMVIKMCCYSDLERKSDETEEGYYSQGPNFEDEAGPSSPLRPIQVMESEEQLKVAEVLVAISRPRGLSIPGPIQSQSPPQQPSQATDPKDKGKGILVEEPKKEANSKSSTKQSIGD